MMQRLRVGKMVIGLAIQKFDAVAGMTFARKNSTASF
jgi:hypothetical protein